jgi:ketosteroid isomerase-like protein
VASRRFSSGTIVVVVVAAAVACWFAYIQFFNDQRAVRRRLNEVAASLSTSLESSDLARLSRLMKLRNYLAEDATAVDQGSLELRSRDEILAVTAQWATGGDGVTATFVDLTVSVAPDGALAQSRFTAQVAGVDPRTGEDQLEEREVMTDLEKRDGEWIITAVRARRPQ